MMSIKKIIAGSGLVAVSLMMTGCVGDLVSPALMGGAAHPVVNGELMVMNDMRANGDGIGSDYKCTVNSHYRVPQGLSTGVSTYDYGEGYSKEMAGRDVYLANNGSVKHYKNARYDSRDNLTFGYGAIEECRKYQGYISGLGSNADKVIWNRRVADKWDKTEVYKNPYDKSFIESGKNVLIAEFRNPMVLVQYRYNTPADLEYIKTFVAPHDYMTYIQTNKWEQPQNVSSAAREHMGEAEYARNISKLTKGSREYAILSKNVVSYHEGADLQDYPYILERYDVLKREAILRNKSISLYTVSNKKALIDKYVGGAK